MYHSPIYHNTIKNTKEEVTLALWSNLGKMASEATAKAVEQAKVLTEVTKLNSQIADEEKRINENYLRIGKLYIEIHADDYEEDFSEMLAAITESEKKIQTYKLQIQDVKGVVRCSKCGAEVAKNAAFCGACGEHMPPIDTVDVATKTNCIKCGSEITEDMRFCACCGAAVASPELNNSEQLDDVPDEEIQSYDPVAVTQEEPCQTDEIVTEVEETLESIPVKRVCAKCGTVLEDNDAFCFECGAKI